MSKELIREILAKHGRLSASIETLNDNSDLYEAGLTSLATVGLMLALEEGFDLEFPDSLLSRKTFSSIEAIEDAIDEIQN